MEQFPLSDSLQVAALVQPGLNNRAPHELHWRHAPPRWQGSIDRAYVHLYDHLQEEVCCLQCGAVPCPYDHDELKQNRLKDLDFVKDMASDKRQLEEQIVKMELQLKHMTDKCTQCQNEKVSIGDRLKQYEMLEKDWERERNQMMSDLARYREFNADNMKKLHEFKKDQEKVKVLESRMQTLEDEKKILQEESRKFRDMVLKQADEINILEKQKKMIMIELEESQARESVLKCRVAQAEDSVEKIRKELWESERRMRELKEEIAKLINEMTKNNRKFQDKELESRQLIEELRDEVVEMREDLTKSRNSNVDLEQRIQELLGEIERLKQKMASDKRFKQFVDIKREVNDLRGKNEVLSHRILEHEIKQPYPIMKRNGRVTTTGSRVSSAFIRQPLETSATKLQRPKSANTLRSPDEFDNIYS